MLLITPVFKQKQSVKMNLSEAGGFFQCLYPLAKNYSIIACGGSSFNSFTL